MARFTFTVMKRIELSKAVTVNAKDEDEAEAKVNEKIEKGLADGITYTIPEGWDVSSDETEVELQ